MKRHLYYACLTFIIALALMLQTPSSTLAQITNPVIGDLGSNAGQANDGTIFGGYFISLWRSVITVGALLVIVFYLWAAVDWISAGGDASKVGKARDKMIQATIGLIILVGSFTIIEFVSALFFDGQFNILLLNFS